MSRNGQEAAASSPDEETPLLRSGNAEAEIETAQISSANERRMDLEKRRRDEMKGYIFMALSALGFSANSVCVKALAVAKFPSLEIVFARSVMQLVLGLLGCLYYGISPVGPVGQGSWPVRKLLVQRGAAGAFGNACFFYALTKMTLADATVVFFTSPVFSAIFANAMLGEPYGAFDRVASAVCMLGIVLVLKPTMVFGSAEVASLYVGDQARGAAAALVGAMSGAFAYCVVRKVGRGVHSMVHVVYFGFLSMAGSSLAMYAGAQQTARAPESTYEWAVMAMVGVFAFFGQVLLNRGLQLAPAGPGTLMRNLDVVFAFLFGITLFGEIPDWISVSGSVVIISCTVAMGLRKWIESRAN
ncbi:hypothetical protein GGI23_003039 [Coemansia sp. RSA 2559]|nr:hypothetical protein GGI23_003039 [Coemansia sp. RSA 2559]KAJ2860180.1 hypothetical protein GGI22_002785 [Coemansia erecta]